MCDRTEFSAEFLYSIPFLPIPGSSSLASTPYRGQVRLVNANLTLSMSSGRVEVFQGQEWGTVCNHANQFTQAAADTVCRQLGYTEALAITDAM